ncbi:MAG: SDR family NAD(P)-dependent oxidoreductase, partial [Acetobacteraceae bacterium]|nr:SDR family NAD(P)-dependent oxidoreductase [Acetobacteraceae bacterium]
RRLTETNYFGTVNGTRVALRRMLQRDRGTIVQVLSAVSYRGVPLMSPYSGSKYALRGFSEAVRAELLHDRSRVHLTMVHPPAVNTPFYGHAQSHLDRPIRPPPPVYQPELIADAIYLAATTRRQEVKVGGQTLALALGNTIAPGWMDAAAAKLSVPAQFVRPGDPVAERDPNLHRPGRVNSTHGPYDKESFSRSPQMWLNRNRDAVGLGLGLIVLAWLAGRGGSA